MVAAAQRSWDMQRWQQARCGRWRRGAKKSGEAGRRTEQASVRLVGETEEGGERTAGIGAAERVAMDC
jgi:hypothetical protein